MGFLLGFFDKTQKPNPAPKKIGFFSIPDEYTFHEWIGHKKKCLRNIALVTSTPPVLPQDPTDNDRKLWE